MKGLMAYIAKHGRHFTTELAIKVIDCKWKSSEVEKASDKVVYYNVTEATLGDIVFLVNLFSDSFPKRRCIKYALDIIGDVNYTNYAFNAWLLSNENIDLNKYI